MGWAIFLEKNRGPQIGGAIFLEKKRGPQIGGAIFLEKNECRRGQHGPTQAENIIFLNKDGRGTRPTSANLGGAASTGPKETARTPTAKLFGELYAHVYPYIHRYVCKIV